MFVFLDRQTKNGNLQLLFQQTCPCMPISGVRIAVPTVLTQHKWRLGRERIREAGETYSPRFTNCDSALQENVHYRAETYTYYKTKHEKTIMLSTTLRGWYPTIGSFFYPPFIFAGH
jgi:hypothetical protein